MTCCGPARGFAFGPDVGRTKRRRRSKSSLRRSNGEVGHPRRRRYLQGGKHCQDMAKVEEARLNGARARLAQALADLSAISVARFGAVRQTVGGSSSKSKLTEEGEGKSKFMKWKLPVPKYGWKDAKGVTLLVCLDRFKLFQHLSNIF